MTEIVNISLSFVKGAHNNCHIEMICLSTHTICFG